MALIRSASLTGGGKIFGDLTIDGDLTVNGNNAGAYDEIINGQLQIYRDDSSTTGDDTNRSLYLKQDGTGDVNLVFSDDTISFNMGIDNSANAFKISTHSHELHTNTKFTLDTSGNATFAGNVGINKTATNSLHLDVGNGTAEFGKGITIETGDGSFTANRGGMLEFHNEDVIIAGIRAERPTLGGHRGELQFFTHNSSSGNTYGSTFLERMRITSTGNVGIGTSSPASYNNFAHNLVVYEAGNSGITIATNGANHTSLYFADGTSGAEAYAGYLDYDHADNSLDIATNGTQAIRIDSSQNATFAGDISVSSGNIKVIKSGSYITPSVVTPDAVVQDIASSGSRLQLLYRAGQGASKGSAVELGGIIDDGVSATSIFGVVAGIKSNATSGDDKGTLRLATNNGTAITTALTIDSSQRVGIGTDSPDHKLKVEESTNGADCTIAIRALNDGGAGRTALLKLDPDAQTLTLGVASIVADISNERIGIGVSEPYNLLHIRKSAVTNSDAHDDDLLVIEETGDHCNINMISDTGSYLMWSDATRNAANINYQHGSGAMGVTSETTVGFVVDSGTRFKLDTNSRISLSNNDGGASNTIFGNLAGNAVVSNTTNNVLIGHSAGTALNSGDSNVMIGKDVGLAGTSATNNIYIGEGVAKQADEERDNTVIGHQSFDGAVNGADYCVVMGSEAMRGAVTQDGTVAIGTNALLALTSGARNLAVGYRALYQSDACNDSIAIGYQALSGTDTGTCNQNIAIGNYALDSNLANCVSNVAIGHNAFTAATGITSCVAVGFSAFGSTATVVRAIAIGEGAMGGAEAADHSVSIGYASMYNTTGAKNTALGYQSGNTITDGTENTVVGYDSDVSASGAVNQTVIGSEATGVADNSVTLGNASVTDVYMSTTAAPAAVHCAKVSSISATGTPVGGGFDGAEACQISVGNYNSEIVTTIYVDLGQGGATNIASIATNNAIIGEGTTAASYLTKITTAINGIVYRGEIICLEAANGGDDDINVGTNSASLAAEANVNDGNGQIISNAGSPWTLSETGVFAFPTGGIQDDYVYLAAGAGDTAGDYTTGKFLLRFYGASTTGL